MADLARRDQLRHRADRFLDRRRRVDAVLVVEVDVIDSQPLQRGLAGGVDVLGAAVDRAPRRLARGDLDAELGGEKDLLAPARDRGADKHLIGVGAVHVRGVEERAAEVQGARDRRRRFVVVTGSVEGRHPHAAESERGDGGSVGSKRARLHAISLLVVSGAVAAAR